MLERGVYEHQKMIQDFVEAMQLHKRPNTGAKDSPPPLKGPSRGGGVHTRTGREGSGISNENPISKIIKIPRDLMRFLH